MKNLKYWVLPTIISVFAIVQVLFAQLPTQIANRVDLTTFVQSNNHISGTITITPGMVGSDTQYIYITGIDVSNCATSAVTPVAPTYITTTNINNDGGTGMQLQVGSGATAGLCQPSSSPTIVYPIRSQTAGSVVTFVVPSFASGQVIGLNVYYRKGR